MLPGLSKKGGRNKCSPEDFCGSENILCDTTMAATCITIYWSRLKECTTRRVNLNVNSGLWMIMMHQVGSSVVQNVALLWGLLIMGKAKPV